jgi:hypothetical protein
MAVILSYSPRSRETAGALRHYLHRSTEAVLHFYVDGLRARPFSGRKVRMAMSHSGERGMLLIRPLAVGILTCLKS